MEKKRKILHHHAYHALSLLTDNEREAFIHDSSYTIPSARIDEIIRDYKRRNTRGDKRHLSAIEENIRTVLTRTSYEMLPDLTPDFRQYFDDSCGACPQRPFAGEQYCVATRRSAALDPEGITPQELCRRQHELHPERYTVG